MLKKSPSTTISSLYSTVKKPKNNNQLHHAKSYDDIFSIQQLDPSEIKILLNNDKSLKSFNFLPPNEVQKQKYCQDDLQNWQVQKYYISKSKQNKQKLAQILQQSVKKQNILVNKQLFDPFKYFGSTSQLSNIQQSSRHHQSRLQAMFSESNSPLHTDHSASYRKKSSPKNKNKKIVLDIHRISNSVLLQKLQKLQNHQKKIKQRELQDENRKKLKNSITQQKTFVKQNKQNIVFNKQSNYYHSKNTQNINTNKSIYCYPVDQKIGKKQYDTSPVNKEKFNSTNKSNMQSSYQQQSFCQPEQKISKNGTMHNQSSLLSSKKVSIQNYPRSHRPRVVNCSPKSYVKQTKQNYLKMNLNNMQKVRLKLKLTSSKN